MTGGGTGGGVAWGGGGAAFVCGALRLQAVSTPARAKNTVNSNSHFLMVKVLFYARTVAVFQVWSLLARRLRTGFLLESYRLNLETFLCVDF
jgi:hypothetical protein